LWIRLKRNDISKISLPPGKNKNRINANNKKEKISSFFKKGINKRPD